jgi:hypothetical protein
VEQISSSTRLLSVYIPQALSRRVPGDGDGVSPRNVVYFKSSDAAGSPKILYSSCLSVRPSVSNNSASTERILMKLDILSIFLNLSTNSIFVNI